MIRIQIIGTTHNSERYRNQNYRDYNSGNFSRNQQEVGNSRPNSSQYRSNQPRQYQF